MERLSLRVLSGPARGTELPLEGEVVLGREAPGSGSLGGDPELSRRHARIAPGPDGPIIEDLGSTNRTVVNGRVLEAPRRLEVGDRIEVGSSVLEVVGPGGK